MLPRRKTTPAMAKTRSSMKRFQAAPSKSVHRQCGPMRHRKSSRERSARYRKVIKNEALCGSGSAQAPLFIAARSFQSSRKGRENGSHGRSGGQVSANTAQKRNDGCRPRCAFAGQSVASSHLAAPDDVCGRTSLDFSTPGVSRRGMLCHKVQSTELGGVEPLKAIVLDALAIR